MYLFLPGNGNRPSGELFVEFLIAFIKLNAFDSGELLDIKNIFAINGSRLWKDKQCTVNKVEDNLVYKIAMFSKIDINSTFWDFAS